MVNSRENRYGKVAAARHAGPGNGILANFPKAQAATGSRTSPATDTSLKATV